VIVVVGDHGIRSPIEDPALSSGVIDDYSFHVPLVIYAPKAFEHTEEIPWVTSHIDIAPSVQSLLGIEQGQSFEQGTPIWDPNLINRTTFFFAHDLMGVDGYYSHGNFFMWNQTSDALYRNTKMSFDGINIVPRTSPTYNQGIDAITRMAGLDEIWATRFSDTGLPHSLLAVGSKP
jgi:arylsulfatase A-like enzyme